MADIKTTSKTIEDNAAAAIGRQIIEALGLESAGAPGLYSIGNGQLAGPAKIARIVAQIIEQG